ncbi:developmental pluripotency-associated protein 3-like [Rhinolophus sinicus]|uniref:developmental pluripotency-associated protein 3-like n=1 Tax=Rhinolophus sinicus TaxID=89399 RepID=UPI003D7B4A7D
MSPVVLDWNCVASPSARTLWGILEELQAVTRLPMDSPMKLNRTSTPESPQMPSEEDSASSQAVSEVLAKNLSNLTLSPSTKFPSLLPECSPQPQDREKNLQGLGLGLGQGIVHRRRRGVRTLATARKERMQRMLQVIRYRTLSLLRKDPQERKIEIESRFRRFRCSCRYCLYHGDPSDNISMENNDDMESI